MMKLKVYFVMLTLMGLLFPGRSVLSQTMPVDRPLTMKVVGTYPHDPKAFTQGLVFEDGFLYESTGEYGSSSLRKVEPTSGKVLMRCDLPERFFAEGMEIVGDKIYQLTWREGVCLVYDKATFRFLDQFRYSGEGWGLAFDGEQLIMSDGSATLLFIDPKTFKTKRKIQVTDRNAKTKKSVPVRNLNELEYVRGEIWANVWQTTRIVRIDPRTGNVIGWIECAAFVPEELKEELLGRAGMRNRVLNGIAFDAAKNRVYITGKNWPVLYEIDIRDQP